jgi:hypothetical protein
MSNNWLRLDTLEYHTKSHRFAYSTNKWCHHWSPLSKRCRSMPNTDRWWYLLFLFRTVPSLCRCQLFLWSMEKTNKEKLVKTNHVAVTADLTLSSPHDANLSPLWLNLTSIADCLCRDSTFQLLWFIWFSSIEDRTVFLAINTLLISFQMTISPEDSATAILYKSSHIMASRFITRSSNNWWSITEFAIRTVWGFISVSKPRQILWRGKWIWKYIYFFRFLMWNLFNNTGLWRPLPSKVLINYPNNNNLQQYDWIKIIDLNLKSFWEFL